MRPEIIAPTIESPLNVRWEEAQLFYSFICEHRSRNCLELGFTHGVYSAYIAGALDEINGHLTAIDFTIAKMREPNIETLLNRAHLRDRVTVHYEERSLNWRLLKMIEENLTESFDLCYLHGGQNLHTTGLAFFLMAELIQPGGWLVFDDLNLSFNHSKLASVDWLRKMPAEKREASQVNPVFSLLVERDAKFGNFRRLGSLGFAQKISPSRVLEDERRLAREGAIALAIERAHSDSEFRFLLIRDPARALQVLTSFSPSPDEPISFEESDERVLPGFDVNGMRYLLSPPSWIKPASRAFMEAMLNLKES